MVKHVILWKLKDELAGEEKEHFRPLNYDLTRYFDSVQTRKVSKDSMIRFQNHQYSVSPNYIEKEVEIKPAAEYWKSFILILLSDSYSDTNVAILSFWSL